MFSGRNLTLLLKLLKLYCLKYPCSRWILLCWIFIAERTHSHKGHAAFHSRKTLAMVEIVSFVTFRQIKQYFYVRSSECLKGCDSNHNDIPDTVFRFSLFSHRIPYPNPTVFYEDSFYKELREAQI